MDDVPRPPRYPGDDPTVWELFRAIETLRRDINADYQALQDRIAQTLVTRDGYEARQVAMGERIISLEQDRHDTQVFRRAMVIALTTVFLTALCGLVLALVHVH